MPRKETVRYAVAGLGWFAQLAVLPAFANASRNSRLVALFSDDREKLRKLGRKYKVGALHGYEDYDEALAAGGIDAVYLTLPNHLHADFTVRAARAGVHVLCEKPMAVTERECEAMIRAADRAGVQLMIAYRLHFERANLKAVEAVRAGKLGEPRIFHSLFANRVTDEGNIRLGPIAKGGGTLYDIGIYCLNAARYLFRSEPEEVLAVSTRGRDRRFDEADEMTSCVLRFPEDRLATFTASFAAADHDFYEVLGTTGILRLEPAFSLDDPLGLRLEIGGRRRERQYPKRDQVAPELLYFSDCVVRGRTPEPSGREGLADIRVIRALYRSAARGRPVRLAPFRKAARPDLRQESYRPPVGKQEIIEAAAPSPE